MTPRSVLEQYMELCSSDPSRLVYQLASNAVLDWNGMTVRGAPKIVKFLRQKLEVGLVQNFSSATVTTGQPFEEREAHIATKTNPPENLIPAASIPRIIAQPAKSSSTTANSPSSNDLPASRSDLSYETPPRTLPAAPHPPPLTAGRRFLSCSSDDEEDGDKPDHAGTSPPAESPDKPKQSAYSELQYLEAIGTIRTANEPKYRGTRTTHHIPREDPSADSSGGAGSNAQSGDKRTKLKVSYRTHLIRSDEAQFALIIYEYITTRATTVRRNLFSGEQSTTEESEPPVPQSSGTSPASPELVPLPDSPPQPTIPPEVPSSLASPVQPPGTPVKRRRVPPIIDIRSSPRRTMVGIGESSGSSSSSSSTTGSIINEIQHTWPRKKHPALDGGAEAGGGPGIGGSEVKYRKLSSNTPTTIRKPLRF